MEDLTRIGIADFTSALASAAPTPGGGGAGALCGALAASLCSMAASLTAGRKKYADRSALFSEIAARAEELRKRLVLLIQEDADHFAPLAAAYSLPKDAPDTAAVLRAATLGACEAPLEMLRCACAVTELLEQARLLASPLLISDVGCGAALARAAIDCAAMNVLVNTRTLPDDEESCHDREEALRLRAEYLPRAEAVSAAVAESLEKA